MNWLITYSQHTGTKHETSNKVIHIHPADWLVDCIEKYPTAQTVLLFAIEIAPEKAEKLNSVL